MFVPQGMGREMGTIDWGGVAAVIGAVGGFLGVCVNLAFSVINFRDARRAKREQETHKELLCSIATQVGADDKTIPPKIS